MLDVVVAPFRVERTPIEGLCVVQMKEVTDDRGTVRKFYRVRFSADHWDWPMIGQRPVRSSSDPAVIGPSSR